MYSQATASPGISNKASCAHVIDRVAKTPGSGSVGAMEYGTMRAAIEGFGPALMIRGYSRKGAQPRLPRLRRSLFRSRRSKSSSGRLVNDGDELYGLGDLIISIYM